MNVRVISVRHQHFHMNVKAFPADIKKMEKCVCVCVHVCVVNLEYQLKQCVFTCVENTLYLYGINKRQCFAFRHGHRGKRIWQHFSLHVSCQPKHFTPSMSRWSVSGGYYNFMCCTWADRSSRDGVCLAV